MALSGEKRENFSFAIIEEVYDDENAYENFENELEKALEAGYSVILIEPSRLGDETARWIAVGNCLHRAAVLAGMLSVGTAFMYSEEPIIFVPPGVLSVLFAGLYTLAWQFDPCEKYQVETNLNKLLKEFPQLKVLPSLTSNQHPKTLVGIFPFRTLQTTPVVLVRRNKSRRKIILHSGISIIAAFYCMWRLYDIFK